MSSDNFKIFPHALIRLGGMPFNSMNSLDLCETMSFVHTINNFLNDQNQIRDEICKKLYSHIPSVENSQIQNKLLNFKRSIFNKKMIDRKQFDQFKHIVPQELQSLIDRYIINNEHIDELKKYSYQNYNDEKAKKRENLRLLAQDDRFLKGLLISSQSLFNRVLDYVNKDINKLNKNDLRTELSLIKYISRMCAKTSPFSTFSNLVMCEIKDHPNDKEDTLNTDFNFKIKKDVSEFTVSHIRLNNYLFLHLKTLLTKNPSISAFLHIKVNPSLKIENECYMFLVNFDNIESFQRIPINPALEVIIELCKRSPEGNTINKLIIEILQNEYIDTELSILENYIYQLVDFGLLEYNMGVSGLDPDWNIKFCEYLDSLYIQNDNVVELISTLKSLHSFTKEYSICNYKKRNEILHEAYSLFKTTCMNLHEAAGLPEVERNIEQYKQDTDEIDSKNINNDSKTEDGFNYKHNTLFYFKPEHLFYEDVVFDLRLSLEKQKILPLISSIQELITSFKIFEHKLEENDKINHYYIEKFKGQNVELLTFYELFYKDFKKPEAEFYSQLKANTNRKGTSEGSDFNLGNEDKFITPKTKLRNHLKQLWTDNLESFIVKHYERKNEKCEISSYDLQQFNLNLNTNSIEILKSSFGSFLQIFNFIDSIGVSKCYGVLNESFPGFGKLISRFLHLFDDSILNEVREWNNNYKSNAILAENCDGSYFNVNIHPHLLENEIWLPGGNNSVPNESQISITDLELTFNDMDQTVELMHKTLHKRIYVLDLGFQSIGRSQLFQMLDRFSLVRYILIIPVLESINNNFIKTQNIKNKSNEEGIIFLPAIFFNNIILQRKTWIIPKSILPLRNRNEENASYFCRLNLWRLKYNIPTSVFISIFLDRREFQTLSFSEKSNFTKDDHKPQYISFDNPYLVDLLGKLLEKVPSFLKIVEMLPEPEHLLRINEERYVSEFVLQWYT